MSDRYPPRYKPGFSEHPIPDPFNWIDRVVPWIVLAASVIVILISIGRYFS